MQVVFRKLGVLFALEQMLFTCLSQLTSGWMVAHRYLAEVTVARVWLCITYINF